jgi:hypothetical protein
MSIIYLFSSMHVKSRFFVVSHGPCHPFHKVTMYATVLSPLKMVYTSSVADFDVFILYFKCKICKAHFQAESSFTRMSIRVGNGRFRMKFKWSGFLITKRNIMSFEK